MNSNYVRKLYELGKNFQYKEENVFSVKQTPSSVKDYFWITIDRTRFTNAYFVAFHPLKKTIVQSWLGLCSKGQKKKKIKLSDLNFRRTLRLFVKTLHQKLKDQEEAWPTVVRFQGSFTQFQIRETIDSLQKCKEIELRLVRNVTPLHLFSGIRFKKQRRI